MNKSGLLQISIVFLPFKIVKYLIQAKQTKQTPSRCLVCLGERNPKNSFAIGRAEKVMYFFATLFLITSPQLTTNPTKIFFPNFLP